MRQEGRDRKERSGSGLEEDEKQKKFCKVKRQVFSFFLPY
jgi:hypothetical protein